MAYLKNTICISFQTNNVWNTDNIVLDVIDKNTEISQITFTRHVFDKDIAQKQQRIFENNPKHGWCGKREYPNESRMLCCEQEDAQFLLNIAITQPNSENNLCNYDTKNEKFIEFYSHEEGKYHGYHYEDERTKDTDRKLNNSTNGIPKKIQTLLREMHDRFYNLAQTTVQFHFLLGCKCLVGHQTLFLPRLVSHQTLFCTQIQNCTVV
jgi:hypothetical protein